MKPASFMTRAISRLTREAGISASLWCAIPALRMRVSISAIGSLFTGVSSVPERHAQAAQQLARLLVVRSRRDERDVQAVDLLDLVVVDLGTHDLLAQAERGAASPVEPLGRDAAEVAHARQGDVDQAIEELPHAIAPQRDHAADRQPLAQLEVSDRLL